MVSVEAASDNDEKLLAAAKAGKTAKVRDLIKAGASVNAKDDKGKTALMWAARNGRTKTVETLIDKGADVNAKDDEGMTALDWAKEYDYPKTIKALEKALKKAEDTKR
jgi:ankyrin repeat protein